MIIITEVMMVIIRDKAQGGVGVSQLPTLKTCHSAGQNDSAMYFCMTTYWTQDHLINYYYEKNKSVREKVFAGQTFDNPEIC